MSLEKSDSAQITRSRNAFLGRLSTSLILATAFLATGCMQMSSKPSPGKRGKPTPTLVTNDNVDDNVDIDDPLYAALVGLAVEVQMSLRCDKKRWALQYIWEALSERLNEQGHTTPVSSVSIITPQPTPRGYACVIVEIGKYQLQLFAPSGEEAYSMIKVMQDAYIDDFSYRLKMTLGDAHATQKQLETFVAGERDNPKKHGLKVKIIADTQNPENAWTLEFIPII
ncbi:MAG: hypothetical protein WC753_04040 [Candidatus Gracilibacteria bacterium]